MRRGGGTLVRQKGETDTLETQGRQFHPSLAGAHPPPPAMFSPEMYWPPAHGTKPWWGLLLLHLSEALARCEFNGRY